MVLSNIARFLVCLRLVAWLFPFSLFIYFCLFGSRVALVECPQVDAPQVKDF